MSTNADRCALCTSASLETVIEMPSLPLTDTLTANPTAPPPASHDQSLRLCRDCGHVQLGAWLPAELLYGPAYRYRSSGSVLGQQETQFFLNSLRNNANKKHYRCILEIGCNDLQLLAALRPAGDHLVGVDPVLCDPSIEIPDGVQAIAAMLEDAEPERRLPEAPDLIICRHTLEHLADPRGALRRFMSLLSADGICVIEIPCLDALIQRGRFDQIFHQHLHYFTRDRLKAAIADCGGRIEWEALSWQNWGAYLVAFSRAQRPQESPGPAQAALASAARLREGYAGFRHFMAAIGGHLDRLRTAGPSYGYGAAQMLPVLAWHLGTDFEWLSSVLDDDRQKHGLTYANLPVTVEFPESDALWKDATVVITALDHAPALLHRLGKTRPKQIVLPLMTI